MLADEIGLVANWGRLRWMAQPGAGLDDFTNQVKEHTTTMNCVHGPDAARDKAGRLKAYSHVFVVANLNKLPKNWESMPWGGTLPEVH